MRCRRPAVLASIVPLAALMLLGAGCGGGGGSPHVANLGPSASAGTTTTTQDGTESAGKGSSGPGGGPGGGRFQIAMDVGTAAGGKFSACMRKHGVTNFPDPSSQGVIEIHSGMGIDPRSPTFTSARSACQKLLPNGGQPTPAQIAQQQKQMLAYSTCMRAHGIKDFPDPTNGGLRLRVGPGSDLDPNNAQFRRAQQACQANLPFKAAPPATAKAANGG